LMVVNYVNVFRVARTRTDGPVFRKEWKLS
jgi:hypothetical protein